MKFPRSQFNPFLNYFYERVTDGKVLKVIQSLCLDFFSYSLLFSNLSCFIAHILSNEVATTSLREIFHNLQFLTCQEIFSHQLACFLLIFSSCASSILIYYF